ncbi:class I SAM-dependent methyltransferase [Sphingomonas glacialis]|uniref:Methyltransferase domain-containing protein n=1 Tax=Sphingomonas glacialis TaxID=658225 RepID=A0A502FS61_9SPHN|nr:methyltransferase domain-containing protein [Sphingomonas glacialis]TPG52251.1 methyltransferase domain-containing protein [Sphingomonas glacialis]
MTDPIAVVGHYDRKGLTGSVSKALADLGLDEGRITSEDLAALDQFHSRGLIATIDLAKAVAPAAGDVVLDIGSGLGGPSRYLADAFGCSVEGVDLSPSYVEVAGYLAERMGLSDRVRYQVGNALSLPFADGSFDIVWTQHVAMNISDRPGLYREVARVLKPGGRFASYDVVAGEVSPIHFPVPWSAGPDTSFLLTKQQFRDVVIDQGFAVQSWIDRTEESIAWSLARAASAMNSPVKSMLGLSLAMGPDFSVMSRNLLYNLEERRAAILEAVLLRR